MTLSAPNYVAADADLVRPVLLYAVQFNAFTLRGCDSDRPIAFGGNLYTPAATLTGIDGVQEAADGKARSFTLRFAGIESSVRDALAAGPRPEFGAVTLYLGLLSASGSLVDTPVTLITGQTSRFQLALGDDNALNVECETSAVLLRRNARQLCTGAGQRLRYPGDTGVDQVLDIPNRRLEWGGKMATADTLSAGYPRGGGDSTRGGRSRD